MTRCKEEVTWTQVGIFFFPSPLSEGTKHQEETKTGISLALEGRRSLPNTVRWDGLMGFHNQGSTPASLPSHHTLCPPPHHSQANPTTFTSESFSRRSCPEQLTVVVSAIRFRTGPLWESNPQPWPCKGHSLPIEPHRFGTRQAKSRLDKLNQHT